MAQSSGFKLVETIGRALPDVEVTTTWGQPTLKVRGKMEHYVGYPCVLVRLSRVHPDALRDLVTGAHRYMRSSTRKTGARRIARVKEGRHS